MAKPATISIRRKLAVLGRDKPVDGRSLLTARGPHGQRLHAYRSEDWDHPWRINAGWDYDLNRWCVWVTPGFVNGYPAVIPVTTSSIVRKDVTGYPEPTTNYGTNPLSGEPYFSSWIFNKQHTKDEAVPNQSDDSATTDVYITDEASPFLIIDSGFFNPLTPVIHSTSEGGFVATAGTYPKFFELVGVRSPDDPASANVGLGNSASTTNSFSANLQEKGNCELRSCDIILNATHWAIKGDVRQVDPATGNITIVSTAFANPPKRFPFRLSVQARHVSPPAYPDILDKLNGVLEEPLVDQLLLARLWLVSPPNTSPESTPDESWVPFAQHFVFWNLGYAQPNYVPAETYDPITINVPLGLGLLALLGNQLLAPINDAQQNAINALNQSSSQGYFWTA